MYGIINIANGNMVNVKYARASINVMPNKIIKIYPRPLHHLYKCGLFANESPAIATTNEKIYPTAPISKPKEANPSPGTSCGEAEYIILNVKTIIGNAISSIIKLDIQICLLAFIVFHLNALMLSKIISLYCDY
jgi:hypothetical protein